MQPDHQDIKPNQNHQLINQHHQLNNLNHQANNQNHQAINQNKKPINNQQKLTQQNTKICEFWVARKRRQCKFIATKGSMYCHAHCSDLQNKIQCPYEKGMFIDKSKFERHMLNCPRLRDKAKQKQSLWYNEAINKVNQQGKMNQKLIGKQQYKIEQQQNNNNQQKVNNQKQENNQENIEEKPLLGSDLTQLPKTLKQIPENQKMISKVIQLYLKCFNQKQQFYIQSDEKQSLIDTTNDHVQAKLIAQKAHLFGLISQKFIYVEFGAGKGILSYAIANKVKELTNDNSRNILLQRQVRRNKFDRFFKQNPFFQRYRSDVSDFDFSLLPKTMTQYAKTKCQIQNAQEVQKQLQKSQMIGVCKHMCGQALDISVRGLLKANCKGNILASCCHHLCNYNTYLNPKFFKEQGWTPEQTQTMFKMSSWGTMSHRFEKDDITLQKIHDLLKTYTITQENKQLSQPNNTQKIIIGRMCKRLIDFGRAELLNGKVYKYCSDQLTPQNYVIISG